MQLDLLGGPVPPAGFKHLPQFLPLQEEEQLLSIIKNLRFETFEMRGVEAKRKIVHYGLSYDFLTRSTATASSIPSWLDPLKLRVEEVLRDKVTEVLVTHYPPGAAIGWHFDAPAFKALFGISLLGACRFQLRKGEVRAWEKFECELLPRDAYVIEGESRWKWQHHIPPVKSERYSLTFRTSV